VWIGESVCILPGVRIGSGSIVGAGSVVTKSIPKDSIAVGNPARVVKVYDRQIGLWRKL
jgi:lipopolysaccharide O-acetyltransferase